MALNEDQQTEAVFKSMRGEVDPVSGNEVPPGSLPEEVRDDVPAMLSEGEYVVPADVLRFYGVKFFEDLRAEAKMGLAEMESNGRIGGEPVMEDDELPFSDEELMVEDMNEGGVVGFQQGGLNVAPDYTTLEFSNTAYQQDPSDPTQVMIGGSSAGYELVTYYGPNGETIDIPFFGGMPLGLIPAGYTTSAPKEKASDKAVSDTGDGNTDIDTDDTPETASVTEMSDDQLASSAKAIGIMGTIGKVALGPVASTALGTVTAARYNDILDEMTVRGLDTSEMSRKGSIFGGEESLLGGLNDTNKDGKVDFGDTFLGDLLGLDGKVGVQGPSLKDSWSGSRRSGAPKDATGDTDSAGTEGSGGGNAVGVDGPASEASVEGNAPGVSAGSSGASAGAASSAAAGSGHEGNADPDAGGAMLNKGGIVKRRSKKKKK